MLLFCDTSALIKLLIDEPNSVQIHQTTEHAGLIAVCRITWAEAMAAMARRQRDDSISSNEIENARQRLCMLWQRPAADFFGRAGSDPATFAANLQALLANLGGLVGYLQARGGVAARVRWLAAPSNAAWLAQALAHTEGVAMTASASSSSEMIPNAMQGIGPAPRPGSPLRCARSAGSCARLV